MDLNTYLLFWVCIFGVCLGSFYNVVILRSLSGESIIFPPSKCPKCNHKLYPWHNIPIISYLILRGKCYFCKEKISIQYPVVEFITMVLFGFTFLKFGLSVSSLFIIVWFSCLLIMTVTDLKEQIVDCSIAIFMAVSGLICSFIMYGGDGLISSVLGLILGGLFFVIISKAGKAITKTEVMGDADAYVAAALGAAFGVYNLPIILILGIFAYALFFVPVFLYKKFKSKNYGVCISLILFCVSAVFCLKEATSLSVILMLIFAISLVYFMFRSIDTSEKMTLPYVPAFSLGALIFVIFFIQEIVYDNSILSDSIQKLLSF